jgi:hypothetical protein
MEAVEAGFAEEVGARNVFKRSRALSRLPGLGMRLILCMHAPEERSFLVAGELFGVMRVMRERHRVTVAPALWASP